MDIAVLGLNHVTAPVAVREKLSLSDESTVALLRVVRVERIFEEALLLSTCNRIEIYAFPCGDEARLRHFQDHLRDMTGCPYEFLASGGYRHQGLDAARHLFRVAASLDSLIVGEDEILSQVKKAYRLALEARTARFLLHKLVHRAFRVGKRVRTETLLNQGASSISLAGVSLAEKLLSGLSGKRAAVIGAGEMAVAGARALVSAGIRELRVINRTPARAEALIRRLGEEIEGRAQALGLEKIPEALSECDLIMCATSCKDPIIGPGLASKAIKTPGRRVLILDIGVPRNVDTDVGTIPGVDLRNIDHLSAIVEENLSRRRSAIPAAEAIVEQEMEGWAGWLDALQVTHSIKQFKDWLESLLGQELRRHARGLSPDEEERLRRFGRALCNKIQHEPFTFLRALSKEAPEGEVIEALDLFHRLFDLEESSTSN